MDRQTAVDTLRRRDKTVARDNVAVSYCVAVPLPSSSYPHDAAVVVVVVVVDVFILRPHFHKAVVALSSSSSSSSAAAV